MIATQILVGRLQMPHIHDMAGVYGTAVYKQIEGMFKAMWDAYLTKGPDTAVSLPYWAKRIKHPKAMNQALKLLSDHNWIRVSTRPNNNWSEAYLIETFCSFSIKKGFLSSHRLMITEHKIQNKIWH